MMAPGTFDLIDARYASRSACVTGLVDAAGAGGIGGGDVPACAIAARSVPAPPPPPNPPPPRPPPPPAGGDGGITTRTGPSTVPLVPGVHDMARTCSGCW